MVKVKMNYVEINELVERVDKFIDESIKIDPNGEQYIDDCGDCENVSYLLGVVGEKIKKINKIVEEMNFSIDVINRIMQDSKAKTLEEASAILRKELVEDYNYLNDDTIEIRKCCDCHNYLKYGSDDYDLNYHLNGCEEEEEE